MTHVYQCEDFDQVRGVPGPVYYCPGCNRCPEDHAIPSVGCPCATHGKASGSLTAEQVARYLATGPRTGAGGAMTDETASVQGEDVVPSESALLSTINGVLMAALYQRALQSGSALSVSGMAGAVLDAIDLPALLAKARAEGEAARTAEIERLREALGRIRDHGETHEEPCWALSNGDCADAMQEIARAALAHPPC